MKKFLVLLTLVLAMTMICSMALALNDGDEESERYQEMALEYASRLHNIDKDQLAVYIEELVKPTHTTPGIIRFRCTGDPHDLDPHFHEIVIPADPAHKPAYQVIVEPTCMEEGYAQYVCSICGEVLDEMVLPVDRTNHIWDEWIVKEEPTCHTLGREERYCKRSCGDKQQRYIATLDPVWVSEMELVEDNDFYALITYTCALCGGATAPDNNGDAQTPHPTHYQYVELQHHNWILDEDNSYPPTCFEDGALLYVCENEATNHDTAIPGDPAQEAWEVGKATDRDDQGPLNWDYKEEGPLPEPDTTVVEANYDALKEAQTEAIPTPGHKWSLWILRTEPHEQENEFGYWIRYCTREATGSDMWVVDARDGRHYINYAAMPLDEDYVVPCKEIEGAPSTEEFVGQEKPVEDPSACDHANAYEAGEAPDCVNEINGFVSVYCPDCDCWLDWLFWQEIPWEEGHNFIDFEAVDPTCTDWGYSAGKYCEYCGIEIDVEYYEPLGHDYQYEVIEEATCEGTGRQIVSCSRCDWNEVEVTEPTGHDWLDLPGYEPTCYQTGVTDGRICVNCGEIEGFDEIPATGNHVLGNTEYLAPTCTEPGHGAGVGCVTPGCPYTQLPENVIPALGHQWIDVEAEEPTCTETGYTAHKECERCGEKNEAYKIIEALGHDYVKEVVKAPTCKDTGKDLYTCSRCGVIYDEVTPKTEDHKWSDWKITKEATKEEDGIKTRTCSVCAKEETETYKWEATEAPKYEIRNLTYDGGIVSGLLWHDDTTIVDENVKISVSVFRPDNTYIMVEAVIRPDGTFRTAVTGAFSAITVAAAGDAEIIKTGALEKFYCSDRVTP